MAKQKFVGEYPINASRKMLFPYLSTATGLCQWFADDVNINNIDKTLIFIVDGEERIAVIDSINKNRYVKFRFLMDGEKPKENDTLEFRLYSSSQGNITLTNNDIMIIEFVGS